MQPEQIWQAALGELQIQLSPVTFQTYLRDSRLQQFDTDSNELVIAMPNDYMLAWANQWLPSTIRRILTGIAEHPLQARFVATP